MLIRISLYRLCFIPINGIYRYFIINVRISAREWTGESEPFCRKLFCYRISMIFVCPGTLAEKLIEETCMKKKGRFGAMFIPTVIMGVLALAILAFGYWKGSELPVLGLKSAGNLLLSILPLLVFAFIIAGMLPLLVPRETISGWVGAESGWRGILIGTGVGCLMPGGPYISLPIAAGLLRVGASTGTMVALLTAWSVTGVFRLPLEIGIMGWKFTAIRLVCSFFFAPVAGFLAERFFKDVNVT